MPRRVAGVLVGGILLFSALALWTPLLESRLHIVFLAAATACFAGLILILARREALTRRAMMLASLVGLALAMAAPPANSNDVSAYAFHGRMVAKYHVNPYTNSPREFDEDPWLADVQPIWRDRGTVYGPLFTGASTVISWSAGNSRLAARVMFQALAALALVVILGLLGRRAGTPAFAAVGLNPIVLVVFVNGGHNDLLVGLGVLAAVILAEQRRDVAVGLCLGAAALVKVTALLPAAIIVAWSALAGRPKRALNQGMVSLATVAVGYSAVGGVSALQPLRQAARQVAFSVWDVPSQISRIRVALDPALHAADAAPVPAVVMMMLLVVAVAVALGGRWEGLAAMVAAGSLVYLLAAPYLLPWYGAWLVVAACARKHWPLGAIALVHATLLSGAYLLALGSPPRDTAWFAMVGFRAAVGIWGAVGLAGLLIWTVLRAVRPDSGGIRARSESISPQHLVP